MLALKSTSWVGTGGSLPPCGSVGTALKGSVVKLSGKRAARSSRWFLSFPRSQLAPVLEDGEDSGESCCQVVSYGPGKQVRTQRAGKALSQCRAA